MIICNQCKTEFDDVVDLGVHVRIEHPVYYKLVRQTDKLEAEKIVILEGVAAEGMISGRYRNKQSL